MGIITDILEQENLTEREQAIRTYVIRNPEKLYDMSARELGEATFSSAAAVTRFCKKVGCRGYQDFRIRFLQDAGQFRKDEKTVRVMTGDSYLNVITDVTEACGRVIDHSVRANSIDSMRRASEMIRTNRYLDFYACGLELSAADYAAGIFMQCGKIPALYKDHYCQICSADVEKPGHLAIVICSDGLNGEMLEVEKCLVKHGTKILCFTKNAESPLGALADHILLMSGDPIKSTIRDEPDLQFLTSFKYLADILFSVEYSERKKERAYNENVKKKSG